MPEISLRGEKYIGVFNGDKREVDRTKDGTNYCHKWYDGSGIVKHRSNGRRHFFSFLVREDYCKSSLKKDH